MVRSEGVLVTTFHETQTRRMARTRNLGPGCMCVERQQGNRSAFSILDVLVTMTVIGVLIGLLLPSLSMVQETARRVVCQSNVRQIGLGLVLYADDHQGRLPPSVFMQLAGPGRADPEPQHMLTLRLDPARAESATSWDGMGILFDGDYLRAPRVFFCPSHTGENRYSTLANVWADPSQELLANYHFRGAGPTGGGNPGDVRGLTFDLYRIDPAQSSLLADGMRIKSDYNHKVGVNFFRADLTVHWYSDPTGSLDSHMARNKDEAQPEDVNDAWVLFDLSANAPN